jgi:hypothetical protein
MNIATVRYHIAVDSGIQISNSKFNNSSFMVTEVVNPARRLGGCTRCFSLNHRRIYCKSVLRCATCFKYGHKFKSCLTRSRPNIFWWPKGILQSEKAALEIQGASMENEGAVANSIFSPKHSAAAENPSHHSDPSTSELAHLLVVPSDTPPSSEMINPRKAWLTSRSTLCHSSRMA